MEIKVSKQTREFAKVIDRMGGSTWVVGGAVRDTFAGRDFVDVDVMVGGVTEKQMQTAVRRVTGKDAPQVVFTAPVFMAIFDGEPTEVAMARVEVSTGQSKHDVEFVTKGVTVREDMERREVTMNSAAWNVMTKQVFDPFGAEESVKSGVMVHTSPAFVESPERGFRAAGFVARFDMEIAPETVEMVREAGVQGFHKVASHQRWMHFEKMAGKSEKGSRWVEVMEDSGWFEMFMPMVKVSDEMKASFDKASVMDGDAKEKASWMVAAMVKGMSDSDRDSFFKVMAFPKSVCRRAKEVVEFGGDKPKAMVQGRDFMAAGMKAGKDMGVAVKAAWKAQMAGEFKSQVDADKFVASWMK